MVVLMVVRMAETLVVRLVEMSVACSAAMSAELWADEMVASTADPRVSTMVVNSAAMTAVK